MRGPGIGRRCSVSRLGRRRRRGLASTSRRPSAISVASMHWRRRVSREDRRRALSADALTNRRRRGLAAPLPQQSTRAGRAPRRPSPSFPFASLSAIDSRRGSRGRSMTSRQARVSFADPSSDASRARLLHCLFRVRLIFGDVQDHRGRHIAVAAEPESESSPARSPRGPARSIEEHVQSLAINPQHEIKPPPPRPSRRLHRPLRLRRAQARASAIAKQPRLAEQRQVMAVLDLPARVRKRDDKEYLSSERQAPRSMKILSPRAELFPRPEPRALSFPEPEFEPEPEPRASELGLSLS